MSAFLMRLLMRVSQTSPLTVRSCRALSSITCLSACASMLSYTSGTTGESCASSINVALQMNQWPRVQVPDNPALYFEIESRNSS